MLHLSSERVNVIAGGSSVKDTWNFPHGYTIGINRAAFEIPCDAVHSMDSNFIKGYYQKLLEYSGEVFLSIHPQQWDKHKKLPNATYFTQRRTPSLDEDINYTRGHNSGFSGLNVAFHIATKEIHLYGYDMTGPRFHEGYSWSKTPIDNHIYKTWAEMFEPVRKQLDACGIKVYHHVNKSGSRIDCFERIEH